MAAGECCTWVRKRLFIRRTGCASGSFGIVRFRHWNGIGLLTHDYFDYQFLYAQNGVTSVTLICEDWNKLHECTKSILSIGKTPEFPLPSELWSLLLDD
jgi:hypothetical protein